MLRQERVNITRRGIMKTDSGSDDNEVLLFTPSQQAAHSKSQDGSKTRGEYGPTQHVESEIKSDDDFKIMSFEKMETEAETGEETTTKTASPDKSEKRQSKQTKSSGKKGQKDKRKGSPNKDESQKGFAMSLTDIIGNFDPQLQKELQQPINYDSSSTL